MPVGREKSRCSWPVFHRRVGLCQPGRSSRSRAMSSIAVASMPKYGFLKVWQHKTDYFVPTPREGTRYGIGPVSELGHGLKDPVARGLGHGPRPVVQHVAHDGCRCPCALRHVPLRHHRRGLLWGTKRLPLGSAVEDHHHDANLGICVWPHGCWENWLKRRPRIHHRRLDGVWSDAPPSLGRSRSTAHLVMRGSTEPDLVGDVVQLVVGKRGLGLNGEPFDKYVCQGV